MLGKLMKYEFRATARYYLPIYAGLVVLALFARLLQGFDLSNFGLGNIMYTLSTVGYGLLAFALAVVTMVVVVSRFYRNLLGQEGYLMFTLPVTAGQNIMSKLFTSMIWFSGSVIIGCFTVLLVGNVSLAGFFSGIGELFAELNAAGCTIPQEALITLLMLLLALSLLAAQILRIYLCLSVGQLVDNHRLLLSVGVYFGIDALLTMGSPLLLIGLAEGLDWLDFNGWLGDLVLKLDAVSIYTSSLIVVAIMLAGCLLVCALLYFISERLLSRRLNLI